jgi:putative resolvase
MKLSEYAQRRGITYRGAWNRWKTGKIPGAFLDESNHIIIPEPEEARLPKAAVYARVSSHPQAEVLDRQAARLVEFANARGLEVVHVVKETASGVDDHRPKLTKLLQEDDWGTLVVEHRDRLTRVGYNWFVVLLSQQGRVVSVANQAEEDKTDIMDDFLSIMYSFAARLYGARGAKNRAAKAAVGLAGGDTRGKT